MSARGLTPPSGAIDVLPKRRARAMRWLVGALLAALAVLSVFLEAAWPVKLYPVLMNVSMLGVFGVSLWKPPTVVERLARLSDPLFPEAAVPYTRRVTEVWCAFFAINAAAAFGTVFWTSTELWLLYNGCLAYALMALLFGGEWLVRQRVKRRLVAARPACLMAAEASHD